MSNYYECSYCQKVFSSKEGLKKHLLGYHYLDMVKLSKTQPDQTPFSAAGLQARACQKGDRGQELVRG